MFGRGFDTLFGTRHGDGCYGCSLHDGNFFSDDGKDRKKTMKKIADSKITRIFAAVSTPKKLILRSEVDFLCPFDNLYPQGYRAVSNPMLATSCVGRSFFGEKSGGGTAFYIFINLQFHSTMPKKMKIVAAAKHSNSRNTSTHETGVFAATIQLQTSNPCLTILSEKS